MKNAKLGKRLNDFAIFQFTFCILQCSLALLLLAKLALPLHQERLNNLEEVHSNESSGPL